MRYERRERQRRLHQQHVREFVTGLLLAAALLGMMGLAECGGPSEAELEAAEIAYWESQGIHIVRDW